MTLTLPHQPAVHNFVPKSFPKKFDFPHDEEETEFIHTNDQKVRKKVLNVLITYTPESKYVDSESQSKICCWFMMSWASL